MNLLIFPTNYYILCFYYKLFFFTFYLIKLFKLIKFIEKN